MHVRIRLLRSLLSLQTQLITRQPSAETGIPCILVSVP